MRISTLTERDTDRSYQSSCGWLHRTIVRIFQKHINCVVLTLISRAYKRELIDHHTLHEMAGMLERMLGPGCHQIGPPAPVAEFIYIRAEVQPANPETVALLNGLVEKVGGQPTPDIVPHTDPGGISFRHARLFAVDQDEAYLLGWDLLPPPAAGAVINDYVVCLDSEEPIQELS